MTVNVWAVVGTTPGYLPLTALTGTAGQLLGMNAGATAAEWKDGKFLAGQFYGPVGSVGVPTYAFEGDLTTGLYRDAAGVIGFAGAGTRRARLSAAGLITDVPIQLLSKLLEEDKSSDIVFAATTDLGTATGNYVVLTNAAGSVSVTSLGGASLPAGTCLETRVSIAGGAVTVVHDTNKINLPGAVNLLLISGDTIRWRKTNDASDFWDLVTLNRGTGFITITTSPEKLVDFLHVDSTIGHRDLISAGWFPAFFNQQWGGAPHYFELTDTATGVQYKFEAATGHIEQGGGSNQQLADAAARTWVAQGFKVSSTQSIPAIWVKVYKNLIPTNNLELRILPDDGTGTKPTGSTAITNGTATAQSGKLHNADLGGQWVRFVFPTPPSLTANTFYHITLKSSGAVDAANYWVVMLQTPKKYPFGNASVADGTPTWTTIGGGVYAASFLVEAATTTASLQSGGLFNDGKLTFFEGTPLNQSNARCKNLSDFKGLDLTNFTLHLAGTAFTKDKTILDITYGIDHDRIVLRCNVTTGFAQIDVYETDGTKQTVTASSVDLSSGDHLIGIRIRARNDGADTIALYIDGSISGTPITAASIGFDTLFGLAQIGTFWLGGGFPIAPTWSGSSISSFSGLPSTLGWTFTGTATEANAFSVSGGKLYQNRNGYTAAQSGYYNKASAGFSNANGGVFNIKLRVASALGGKDEAAIGFGYADGTRAAYTSMAEFYARIYNVTVAGFAFPQLNLKNTENVVYMLLKGNDQFAFVNGRLICDGTTLDTAATATADAAFGDFSVTANENADAIYSYVKYYTTAWLPPQITSGSVSELAIWNSDKTSLFPTLWNSASPLSVKQVCGLEKNWIGEEVVQYYTQRFITLQPTFTATTLSPEMEIFCIGRNIRAFHNSLLANSLDQGGSYTYLFYDGIFVRDDQLGAFVASNAGQATTAHATKFPTMFGLHKIECKNSANNTGTSIYRKLEVEART